MSEVAADNAEALQAWNGVLFDRFVAYRHLTPAGLLAGSSTWIVTARVPAA
jgi:hypothetical protein